MKVIVASTQVPFIRGGAEAMTEGLLKALREAGHSAELVTLPFRFSPLDEVVENMESWESLDFERFDAGQVDHLIALKFPAFNVQHPRKTVWLMHQHRSVYELFDTSFGEQANERNCTLREKILRSDCRNLSSARAVFTISQTVSDRLKLFNDVESEPLYQPPPGAEYFTPGPVFPYVYCPSRLEKLKRQDLLIKAMQYVKSPVAAVIAGEGGMAHEYKKLAYELGVENRVSFVGHVDPKQMCRYYSNCLAVFFGPFSEDYGFITLEAMLSGKPVVTCTDSGGPMEFVLHGQTGFVVPPDPEAIAVSIDDLWNSPSHGRHIGMAGLERYGDLGISWNRVVEKLGVGL
ncbi:glycosyltransferase family 4 protein [Niveibacterium sp. 24ML]|uniref:glycosyltransferase family 4 protein n=1 Tax=Niveibacterium sp. 24ML TaxID=2985512 RepID=UPI002271C55C|nr:glycosyltransferase family 4 protein [Niveibacterium sp. 24ML]MCX9158351.1 glycosyltransferase family 4 protein [Niveibacterium sp. 24ML]